METAPTSTNKLGGSRHDDTDPASKRSRLVAQNEMALNSTVAEQQVENYSSGEKTGLKHLSFQKYSILTEAQVTNLLQDLVDKSTPYSSKEGLIDMVGLSAIRLDSDVTRVVDVLIEMINNEEVKKHHRILVKLMRYLNLISQCKTLEVNRLLNLSKKFIRHSDPSLRCISLKTISDLQTFDSLGESLGLIEKLIQDYDPIVRTSAYDALLNLHARKFPLHVDLYKISIASLTDDHESVRSRAMKLIWILGKSYPNHAVSRPQSQPNSSSDVRLIDDAFVKICDMVNDRSVEIRTEACSLMGSMNGVSISKLMQTFSKEVLSHGRVIQTGSMTSTSASAQGDKEVRSIDEINILESGAAGAFIHGLEDEYLEVRNAAIDSICELGSQSEEFSKKALDFLVDMFNDEIDSVRINAINSVKKLRNHVQLSEDQLDVGLGVLEDFNVEIRKALHELLCCIQLADTKSFHSVVVALQANMNKYPQDKLDIYRCFKYLGRHHGSFAELLIEELLSVDSPFLVQEPEVGNINYTGILITYMNACDTNPNIIPLLPKYAVRHYDYLREQHPDLFPWLEIVRFGGDCVQYSRERKVNDIKENNQVIKSLVDKSTENLNQFLTTGLLGKSPRLLSSLSSASRNFSYLSELKMDMSDWATFLRDFSENCVSLFKTYQRIDESTLQDFWTISSSFVTLQSSFIGLSQQIKGSLNFLSSVCRILGLVCLLHSGTQKHSIGAEENQTIVQEFNTLLRRESEKIESKYASILQKVVECLEKSDFESVRSLLERDLRVLPIKQDNRVHRVKASIAVSVKAPFEQYHGLPFVLDFEGWVQYAPNPKEIRIRIQTLDGVCELFPLVWEEISPTSPLLFEFKSTVRVYMKPWTERGHILVDVVYGTGNIGRTPTSLQKHLSLSKDFVVPAVMEEILKVSIWPRV